MDTATLAALGSPNRERFIQYGCGNRYTLGTGDLPPPFPRHGGDGAAVSALLSERNSKIYNNNADRIRERNVPSRAGGADLGYHMLRTVELHLPHRDVLPRGLSDHGGRHSERKFPHAIVVGVKFYTMHCGLGKEPPRESEPSETHSVCSPDVLSK